jgi:methylmalonyl-CoA mutase, N-terminal domain
MTASDRLKDRIQAAYRRWESTAYKRSVEKHAEREREFTTASFEPVKPLYTPIDAPQDEYVERIGFPGDYPYTRGVQATMYRSRFWTMRQYSGFGTAAESNRRFRYLLSQGQTGLSVAFDLPTQLGYDSDDPKSAGEIGRVGVAIDTLGDMERLLDAIPLDRVTTSMTINAPAAVLLAMYLAVAENRGIPKSKLGGTIQNDILKEYIARGTYIFPPRQSMRIVTDIFEYCYAEVPKWNTISISGYHIREAGSTAAQEVGFTLADGIAYVAAAMEKGLPVDSFAKRLSFFFNAHNDLLEETAKYRAARRLWARIMRERFEAKDPASWTMRFHAQTAGSTLTAQQIDNNVVRVTIQSLAAVLGGAQSLHTNARDEALALPTEHSTRLALRTQQIIAHESGVANTVDPLAGSYYVESLTDSIERQAQEYIDTIDSLGGMIGAIEDGFVRNEIQAAAYRHHTEVESGRRIIVGVNEFRTGDQPVEELHELDAALQNEQIAYLNKVRGERNGDAVRNTLSELKRAAGDGRNLMPPIIDAVRAYASVGEICNTLREVFGEYGE